MAEMALENLPAGQRVHVEVPSDSANFPASQGMQAAADVAPGWEEYLPGKHGWQVDDEKALNADENLPAGQALQVCEPATSANVPWGQSRQMSIEVASTD